MSQCAGPRATSHAGRDAVDAARGEPARVRLVRIPQVAVPKAPPDVAKRESTVCCKLMHVPELEQEQFRGGHRAGREPDRTAERDSRDGRTSETPPSDAYRQAPMPPMRLGQLRIALEQR